MTGERETERASPANARPPANNPFNLHGFDNWGSAGHFNSCRDNVNDVAVNVHGLKEGTYRHKSGRLSLLPSLREETASRKYSG